MTNKFLFFGHVIFLFITYLSIGLRFHIACFAFYFVNITALNVNVLSFSFRKTCSGIFEIHMILLYLPLFLIHGVYSATIAGNLPYFYLLCIGKYNNYLLPLDGISIVVPVQNIYELSFPFHPILKRSRYV